MKKNSNNTKQPDTRQEIRWRKDPILQDKQLLEELYISVGTLDAVAEKTQRTRYQVYRAVKAHGLNLETLKLKRDAARSTANPVGTHTRQLAPITYRAEKNPAALTEIRENCIPKQHIMEFDPLYSQNCSAAEIYARDSGIWNFHVSYSEPANQHNTL